VTVNSSLLVLYN